jgi:hypothetical protein
MAKRNSKQRIDPLIEESPVLARVDRQAASARETPATRSWRRSSAVACW